MVDRFERFSLAIFETSRCWNKIAAEEMKKYGLKGSHATYLVIMCRHEEGITATRLCELSGRDKSDVSRMMSILEKKGLVKREGANKNLYQALLKLTDEGKIAADRVSERARLAVEIAGYGISDENRIIFYETFGMIVSNLQELRKKGLPKV